MKKLMFLVPPVVPVMFFGPLPVFAGTLFTLPDASSTLNQIGAYSSPVFTDILPLVLLIVGVLLAFVVVKLLISALTHH